MPAVKTIGVPQAGQLRLGRSGSRGTSTAAGIPGRPTADHLAGDGGVAPLSPSALPRCCTKCHQCTQTATQRYPMPGAVLCLPVPDSISSSQLAAPSFFSFLFGTGVAPIQLSPPQLSSVLSLVLRIHSGTWHGCGLSASRDGRRWGSAGLGNLGAARQGAGHDGTRPISFYLVRSALFLKCSPGGGGAVVCPSRACSLLPARCGGRSLPRGARDSIPDLQSRRGRRCPAVDSPRVFALYLPRRRGMSISTQSIACLPSSPPCCDAGGTRPARGLVGKRLLGECHRPFPLLTNFWNVGGESDWVGVPCTGTSGAKGFGTPLLSAECGRKVQAKPALVLARQAIGQGSKKSWGSCH